MILLFPGRLVIRLQRRKRAFIKAQRLKSRVSLYPNGIPAYLVGLTIVIDVFLECMQGKMRRGESDIEKEGFVRMLLLVLV